MSPKEEEDLDVFFLFLASFLIYKDCTLEY